MSVHPSQLVQFADVETEDGIYTGQMRRHPMQKYQDQFIKHGKGQLKFKNGDVYDGQFSFDVLEGNGILRYADGRVYEGEFKCHTRHGVGVLDNADGTSYEGHWAEDEKSGEGTQLYTNGDRYQGLWLKHKRHGYGILTFANGERYEGLFENDLPHGEGTYWYTAGDRYEGRWQNGERSGKGIHYTTDGIQMLENHEAGECTQGVRKGNGTVKYPNGDVYCGAWQLVVDDDAAQAVSRGMKHGQGTLILANGDRYEGEFHKDKKQGSGVYHFQQEPTSHPTIVENDNYQTEFQRKRHSRKEIRYEGMFYEDKINGYGVMYYSNGDQHEGFWADNRGEGLGFDIKKGDHLAGAWSADSYKDGRMVKNGKWNYQAKDNPKP
eukprot:TRINITY_DN113742_c0_g1_i1.p2 TRINITY_DN113742_c0_g1~~TRINITY_DN113742_c0_g1_i1.p2  ORF type:complete len:379 (+),score=42.13 TRINITY_DN113742_c0_g1_i1:38-1174(+)